MNEFILTNFFAQLASENYYQKKGYESIGQFGVGVFSYFLLCDFFDVNTRMENEQPLHFRAFKRPKTCFRFFDTDYINEIGTQITLYLSKEISNNFDYENLVEIVTGYIRYVDIPIYICEKKEKERLNVVTKRKIDIENENEILGSLISFDKVNEIENLKVLKFKFNNTLFEGSIGLIIGKVNKKYSVGKGIELCYERNNMGNLKIDVSQKGIFVGSYQPDQFALERCYGNINVKKNINLLISRHGFVDSDATQSKIRGLITNHILRKLFNLWKKDSLNEKYINILNLIGHYFSNYSLITNENILIKHIIVQIFNNQKGKFITLKNLLKKKKIFLYVTDEFRIRKFSRDYQEKYYKWLGKATRKDLKQIYEKFKLPILYFKSPHYAQFFGRYFSHKEYFLEINMESNNLHLIMHTGKKRELDFQFGLTLIELPSKNILGFTVGSIFESYQRFRSIIFNKNNQIIVYYLSYKTKTGSDFDNVTEELFQKFFDKVDSVFNSINNGWGKIGKSEIDDLNKILNHLNSRINMKFTLGFENFPAYYHA